jgi:hypothetical protein
MPGIGQAGIGVGRPAGEKPEGTGDFLAIIVAVGTVLSGRKGL